MAKALLQLIYTDPNEIGEKLHTNHLARNILREALSLYVRHVQSQPGIAAQEDETLSAFLDRLTLPLAMTLTEIALSEVPAQERQQFSPGAVRAWSYCLFREDNHISGHFVSGYFLAARGVCSEEPALWEIVRDILIGHDLGDAEDNERLYTLFTQEQIGHLGSVDWYA